MPVTKIGIVYGQVSKAIRKVIIPATDAELDSMTLAVGEVMLVADKANGTDQATVKNAVQTATGVKPPNGRCAIVDGSGNVVGIISACPTLDAISGMSLVASDAAMVGWTWTASGGFKNGSGQVQQGLIKATITGASNAADSAFNNNQSFVTQSNGLFKAPVTQSNVATIGAGTSFILANFDTLIKPSYDASYPTNILGMQIGGGNSGDLSDDPASVTPFCNRQMTISQKFKTLNPGNKVIVSTTIAYGCTSDAMVANYAAANALLLADTTNFDAHINLSAVNPIFIPSKTCPALSISANCNELTQAGQALLVPAWVTAVNSVF